MNILNIFELKICILNRQKGHVATFVTLFCGVVSFSFRKEHQKVVQLMIFSFCHRGEKALVDMGMSGKICIAFAFVNEATLLVECAILTCDVAHAISGDCWFCRTMFEVFADG